MNTYKFNIGLNNNPFTFEQVRDHVESQFGAYDIKEAKGKWEGADEPTIVFTIKAHSSTFAHILAEALCIRYTQTAIAFVDMNTGSGVLAYKPGWHGHMYDFDHDYFID